ncbi:hypothetical protein KO489_03855 [Reinekea forsetii]|nr:hypothetical protein [Reinekea forsetii]
MANASKDMLKLNSKLDAVLDKLVETESLEDLKSSVIELLEQDNWEEAKLKVTEGSKLSEKHQKLTLEELSLREALDALRQTMIDLTQNGPQSEDNTEATPHLNVVNE